MIIEYVDKIQLTYEQHLTISNAYWHANVDQQNIKMTIERKQLLSDKIYISKVIYPDKGLIDVEREFIENWFEFIFIHECEKKQYKNINMHKYSKQFCLLRMKNIIDHSWPCRWSDLWDLGLIPISQRTARRYLQEAKEHYYGYRYWTMKIQIRYTFY